MVGPVIVWRRDFGIRLGGVAAVFLLSCARADAHDAFDAITCGTDVTNSLTGKPMPDRPVMEIEARHRTIGPKDLGADEVEEDGRLRIAQVSRSGCELILSDQWPDEAGRGLLFISLARADLTGSHLKLRTGASN